MNLNDDNLLQLEGIVKGSVLDSDLIGNIALKLGIAELREHPEAIMENLGLNLKTGKAKSRSRKKITKPPVIDNPADEDEEEDKTEEGEPEAGTGAWK